MSWEEEHGINVQQDNKFGENERIIFFFKIAKQIP